MNQPKIVSVLRMAVAVLATAFFVQTLHAAPYASGVTNSGGTVSFILNESGGNVTVTYQDGSTNASFNGFNTGTNLARGKYSFALGGNTSYRIAVNKIGAGAPNQISVDTSNASGSDNGYFHAAKPLFTAPIKLPSRPCLSVR